MTESMPNPDPSPLHKIREEDSDPTNEKADDVSVLSTSSRSTSRFRMPSLRRRVADNSNKQQPSASTDRDNLTSSPTSISAANFPGRRSRRSSEAQSEDEISSLERLGVARTPSSSWGFGDEVAMGLD